VIDPIFWLGLSILLVAVSLTAMLVAAMPAFQELARAARSAEKLFDMLSRELPPTLEAVRLTGTELTNLSEDVSQNVQTAGRVVDQFDQSLSGVRRQAKQAQIGTRRFVTGVKAAWQSFHQSADPLAPIEEELEEADDLDESDVELGHSQPAANRLSGSLPSLNLANSQVNSQASAAEIES
jgi:uncharacterized protein YoxC